MQLKDQSSAPQECRKSLALTEGIDLTRTCREISRAISTLSTITDSRLRIPKLRREARGRVGWRAEGALDEGSQHSLRDNPESLHTRDQRRALDIHLCCCAVGTRHSSVRHF